MRSCRTRLLGSLFLLAGVQKIPEYAGISAYMSSHGVRPAFLPVVIATEILGALAIVLGWKTRLAAFLLAGYALLTAVIFHRHFADQIELVLLLTDVSIAGGLLLLVANGSGPLSLDHRGTNVRTLGALRDQCWGYRARSIPSSNRALSTLLA